MTTRRLSSLIAPIAALAWIGATTAWAQDEAPGVTVRRGITGETTFVYDGPELIADPRQDLAAPLLLRIERDPDDPSRYAARFIGSVEGEYDLRTLIQRRDGTRTDDLPPLRVQIVSNLPDGAQTDLFDAADLQVGLTGGYTVAMLALAGVWLGVPVVVVGRRLARRAPEETVEAAPPPPTLADQLRPLVEAAAQRELSVHEQARLELLLYSYWRRRVAPEAPDVAGAITIIRADPVAGELLEAVEAWLHRPGEAHHDPDRLAELLAPYREARPIDEASLAHAEAVVTP